MYSFQGGQGMSPAGFPHSEICGSRAICASPQLIAAYHVLHRLLTPRHPPCALSSLTEHSRCSMARLTRQLVFSCQRSLSSKPDESGWVAVIYRRGVGVSFRRDEHSDRTLVEIAGIEPATSGLQS